MLPANFSSWKLFYYLFDGSLECGETDLTSTQKKACRKGSLDSYVIDKANEMLLAGIATP